MSNKITMLNHRLIDGFMESLENTDDPNDLKSIAKHATYAIIEAFNAWKEETQPHNMAQ